MISYFCLPCPANMPLEVCLTTLRSSFWLMVFQKPNNVSLLFQNFFTNNIDTASKFMVWHSLKVFLRSLIIKEISPIKCNTKEQEEALMLEVNQWEVMHITVQALIQKTLSGEIVPNNYINHQTNRTQGILLATKIF